MKQFIFRYLGNRFDYYSGLIERIPYAAFANALKTATFPFEESDEVVKEVENLEDSALQEAIPESLLLDDLLKKSGVGQQLSRTIVSMRGALSTSERIENIGFLLFDALSKQELTNSPVWSAVALKRRASLMNILQLRDDLDFHRLRLP
ncbi:hypothetical protein KKC97_05385 [bacterium]|nr:hypothetical protein [bacterium]MBU1637082.1 hypothetical protein [bacterium]MBU1920865.1 hypothetical protein [bacterium]